jgi:imidazole glycerol-phosphate synthase subunit HisF
MLRNRVIPALLLRGQSLVKTVQFGDFRYVGDPCNTVRIFNELEVDELLFLDITATAEARKPNLDLIRDIGNECFMPIGYGGGVKTIEQARSILKVGAEKVVINTAAIERPEFLSELAAECGSQAVVGSIDVLPRDGRFEVMSRSGRQGTGRDAVEWAMEMEALGAGEVLITSIEREGSWRGFDLELVRTVSSAVGIPVVAHGGAGSVAHIREALLDGGADAVAVGSMVVFQKKGMGVLVGFPPEEFEALRQLDRTSQQSLDVHQEGRNKP